MPIGTQAYVSKVMEDKADEIVSYIEKTVTQLRSEPHAIWTVLYYCLQNRLDYWLQMMPPTETEAAARRVDDALEQAVIAAARRPTVHQGEYIGRLFNDELLLQRLRLPIVHKGAGIRARVHLRHAAFAASFVAAAECFLGQSGFFPELESIFGMHAFSVGGQRFARFCAAAGADVRIGGAVADALVDAWSTMRLELGDAPTTGPLAVEVADAGRGVASHLQRAITK